MPANESDAEATVSERETQFVPRPDDDQVLWTVEEITAERGNKYKVKWAGIDPSTGKPWAQSWVAKHDCTDDLVMDWKVKKRNRAAGKMRGGRKSASTASRASVSTKRAESLTSRKKTRTPASRATSSRLDSVEQRLSPAPKRSTAVKRKRDSETPVVPTRTSKAALPKVEEEEEEKEKEKELQRPRKKQKTDLEMIRKLVPPMTSDESEDDGLLAEARARPAMPMEVQAKSNGVKAPVDASDDVGGVGSPPRSKPKDKPKPAHRSDARSKAAAAGGEVKVHPPSKTKARVVRPRVVDSDVSQDEEPGPSRLKRKSTPKREPTPEQGDGSVESEEVDVPPPPLKVGPPRGAKRRRASKVSGSRPKRGSSHTKHGQSEAGDECAPSEEPKEPAADVPPTGDDLTMEQDVVDISIPTSPLRISTPPIIPSTRLRSPDLSPGARARLELFDRMMAETDNPPPADISHHVADDIPFNLNDIAVTFEPFRPLSPSPIKSKPGASNGLVVPETESSGNSQSQSQPLLEPPSPRLQPARSQSRPKPADLPTIAVIAASAPSSVSPQELVAPPLKSPLHTNQTTKKPALKPVLQISPAMFLPNVGARPRVTAQPEAPMSSIESFTSPNCVNKGKQRALENDEVQSSLSEGEAAGEIRKVQVQKKVTDSQLRRRGKELFDQNQLAREAELLKKKKKAKRLKTVNDIVNGTMPSLSSRDLPAPPAGETETVPEVRLEEVINLSGGNSMTLDTQERSEAKPLTPEDRDRLRVELRQEEEESTQEAMGIYPPPPVGEPDAVVVEDVQMPPPRSPKEHVEQGDHVDQPSTDIQHASVIVQASQEPRHEETEFDASPGGQPTSSPPFPVPEDLTDSPGRRLGEALSLLNVKSEEIQRLESELADAHTTIKNLQAELVEVRQSSEPTGPVRAAWDAERAQWSQERSKWAKDLAEWQAQCKKTSEERASLSARMAELSEAAVRAEEATAKVSELEADRVAWTREREVMLNDLAQRSKEVDSLSKVTGEHDQDRTKREVETAEWVEEKIKWEVERTTLQEKRDTLMRSVDELRASTASLTSTKASAEKDRDFFREQYVQASAFVTSVRDENVELEKRVKIAEGQAQEGVAAIKALFEGRVKTLQVDIDRWKRLTELLQEKDKRTNDTLRLQAAEVPELSDRCDRLTAEKVTLEADVRKLGRAQQRGVVKRNKLYYQIFSLKKERASLRGKLAQLAQMTEGTTQETSEAVPALSVVEDFEGMDPNDMEIPPDPTPLLSDLGIDEPALYPCMWRPQWRDQCQQVFDTKEDLERHMQEHFRDLIAQ